MTYTIEYFLDLEKELLINEIESIDSIDLEAHSEKIINNLFALTAEKMQTLELRINILAQKNVRQKLLAYLDYAGRSSKGEKFSAGMSITELAAYLNVDRSSLMREMKRMKDEGIIWSEGRWFKLLQQ